MRILISAALVMTLGFVGAILLITRTQASEDTELRGLLIPEDCTMPCFMGIRPGITTMDEALAILEGSEWVDTIDRSNSSYITWTWSDSQIFDPTLKGEIRGEELVYQVGVQTVIPVGYMYLWLGEPRATDSGPAGPSSDALVSGLYLDRSIQIVANVPCPVTLRKFWDAPMTIHYLSDAWQLTGFSYIDYWC